MVREHRGIVLERPAIACQEYILYRYRIVRLLSSTLIFTIAGHDQHQRKLDGGYRAASFGEFRDRGRYHINLSAFDLSVSKSKTFTGAVHNPAAKLSDIIRDVLCNFTDTLETFMLRLKGNNGVETLSHSAVRIFGHCRRLKNFLFNSRICIARPDWWVLHRLYNKVDRAIFLRLSYRPLKVEKNFWAALRDYLLPDHDVLRHHRGFLSEAARSWAWTKFCCASHDRVRFLQEIDTEGLLQRIPDKTAPVNWILCPVPRRRPSKSLMTTPVKR